MPLGAEKVGMMGAAGSSGGDATYYGDSSNGSVNFNGGTVDGLTAGSTSYGVWHHDGSESNVSYTTPLASSGVYQYVVQNKSGSYDGDMLVKQYSSLTIGSGYVLTTDQPCKGMLILVDGDCTLNGKISMSSRGANVNPTTAGVAANGIQVTVEPSSGGLGESLTGGAVFDGCGTAAIALESEFPSTGSGTVLSIPRAGMLDDCGNECAQDHWYKNCGADADNWTVSSSWGARPADAGKTGSGGGGPSKWGTNCGGDGSCFAGGPATGGCYVGGGGCGTTTANDNGGAGGNGYNGGDFSVSGGAGNPGGSYTGSGVTTGGDGCGGLIILLVSGDLTIGASGGVYSEGSKGGTRTSNSNKLCGSCSGGGSIIVGYGGTLSNSGTISAAGGVHTDADNSDLTSTAYHGVPGGDGSVQLINLSA